MKLNVNIDHFATLRNARGNQYPDPIKAAMIAEDAGAHGIVCHLREDRRHIRDEDVSKLKSVVRGQFDFEISLAPEIIDIALRIKPDLVTLVPENRKELTTEGGIDIDKTRYRLIDVIPQFKEANIAVSLFVEPTPESVNYAKELQADMIELHTGHYADYHLKRGFDNYTDEYISRFRDAANRAKDVGIKVAAGHGLTLDNIAPIAAIKEIDELSIGHALIADAMFIGLDNAVKAYLTKIQDQGA